MDSEDTVNLDGEVSMYIPLGREQIVTDTEEQEHYKTIAEDLVEEYPDEWGASWADDCGIWNSHDVMENILSEHDSFEPLCEKIVKRVQAYTDMISYNVEEAGLELHESWLNANEPKHVQECHTHGYSFISGVYYVYNPEGGGDFVMENPIAFESTFPSDGDSPLSLHKKIEPKTGELILFPSNLEHHVTLNTSDEMRYSLAFNVTSKNLVEAP